jgi:hypothetical protein
MKDNDTTEQAYSAHLQLFNLGRGAAKELRINWTADLAALATRINAASDACAAGLHVEVGDGHVSLVREGGRRAYFNISADMAAEADYLMTTGEQGEPVVLRIPLTLQALWSLSYFLAFRQEARPRPVPETPSASVLVTFRDIADVEYRALFEVSARLTWYRVDEDGNDRSLGIMLEHRVVRPNRPPWRVFGRKQVNG